MKPIFTVSAVAVLFVVAPSPCFALWDVEIVSKERAKELGMEVRSPVANPNLIQVELEFKAEGALKNFSQVEMSLGKGDDLVAALLREDRSKPGRVVVSVTVGRAQLHKLNLTVRVPFRDGGAGGTIYDLRVKDFIEVKKDR